MQNFTPGNPRNDIKVGQGTCNECGLMHPPQAGGCPMGKQKKEETIVNADGSTGVIDYDATMLQMRNIMTSQIKSKDIKDHKKFFANIIVAVTMAAENYKE